MGEEQDEEISVVNTLIFIGIICGLMAAFLWFMKTF